MRGLRRALPLAIAAATFLVFLPALRGEFVNWDDDKNFLYNSGFRGLGWAQIKWMWTTTLSGHFIPLTWMTLGLNYVLGGMNPWGYHLGNILVHSANAVAVYFVGRRLLAAAGVPPGGPLLWGAALAALVFSLHPLRVESVAWITERRDVLCAFFFLLTILAYLRSLDPAAPRRGWRLASLAAFVAALLSKAQAVPLPAALLIADAYPLRRADALGWRRLLLEKLPYFVLAGAAGVVALLAVKVDAGFTGYERYGLPARIGMTAYGLVFYPWKWLWPVGLSPLYELPPHVDPLATRFLVPLVVLVVATAGLVALRRRWPGGLAAWLYSVAILLPVVGPVHAGHQLAHDRYSYLSGLGFAVLAGAGLVWVLRAYERRLVSRGIAGIVVAGAALVLGGLGAGTWSQAASWRDSEALWRWAAAADPQCVICYNNLGTYLWSRGRAAEAEDAYRRSLGVREHAMTRNNLGTALVSQGRLEEAEREFKEALRQDPELVGAVSNLGALYAKQGRSQEALGMFRRAFELSPGSPEVRGQMARILSVRGTELGREGRFAEAEVLFRQALQIRADDAEALRFLGEILLARGQVAEAVAVLQRSVALDPRAADARLWLARAYLRMGDRERADAEVGVLRVLNPAMADAVARRPEPRPARKRPSRP